MNPNVTRRHGSSTLELLFVLALVAFVVLLIPSLGGNIVWAIDFRNWPRTVWFMVNWLVLGALLMVRFAPGVYRSWAERCERKQRMTRQQEKQETLREQRKQIEAIKKAQSRRSY